MNTYRMVTKDAGGTVLSTGFVDARSLEVAASAMRAELRRHRLATRSELWLGDRCVSVIRRRHNRFVMTDEPDLADAKPEAGPH